MRAKPMRVWVNQRKAAILEAAALAALLSDNDVPTVLAAVKVVALKYQRMLAPDQHAPPAASIQIGGPRIPLATIKMPEGGVLRIYSGPVPEAVTVDQFEFKV